MAERSTNVFDEVAADYRKIHNETIGFTGSDSDYFSEQKVETVRRNEAGEPSILDLGCGDGNSAVYFRQHFPGSAYQGIDTSGKSIEIALGRNLSGAEFSVYDGGLVPFKDASFDVVFTACVMHHVQRSDHPNFAREAFRVLKPGGRLYVFEHNPWNPLTRKVVRECPFDEGVVLLRPSYARNILTRTGFAEVSVNYTLFFPRHRVFRPFWSLEDHLSWLPVGGQYFARGTRPPESSRTGDRSV